MNLAGSSPASLVPIWVPSPLCPWHMPQLVALALPAAASAACAAPANPTDPTINAASNRRFIMRFLSAIAGSVVSLLVVSLAGRHRHVDDGPRLLSRVIRRKVSHVILGQ